MTISEEAEKVEVAEAITTQLRTNKPTQMPPLTPTLNLRISWPQTIKTFPVGGHLTHFRDQWGLKILKGVGLEMEKMPSEVLLVLPKTYKIS